uniref:Uncharacterized protein MANES_14G038300 n=1 Tax=Rhizophora mucronata TaxID=61149 RepID=A0A2P2LTT6_RHIMU
MPFLFPAKVFPRGLLLWLLLLMVLLKMGPRTNPWY